jgi:hypothetical protein
VVARLAPGHADDEAGELDQAAFAHREYASRAKRSDLVLGYAPRLLIELRWLMIQVLGRQRRLGHGVELGLAVVERRLERQAHLELRLVLLGLASARASGVFLTLVTTVTGMGETLAGLRYRWGVTMSDEDSEGRILQRRLALLALALAFQPAPGRRCCRQRARPERARRLHSLSGSSAR